MWLGRIRISSISSHLKNVRGNDVPAIDEKDLQWKLEEKCEADIRILHVSQISQLMLIQAWATLPFPRVSFHGQEVENPKTTIILYFEENKHPAFVEVRLGFRYSCRLSNGRMYI